MCSSDLFFQTPALGNNLLNQTKMTKTIVADARQWILDALLPLIQCGRASTIEVFVERDSTDKNRLNYRVEAMQPNGLIVQYSTFYSVV